MARAAKVPKFKRRWRPEMFLYIDRNGGWRMVSANSEKGSFYTRRDALRACRAMNLLEAIERGELIVKEAE